MSKSLFSLTTDYLKVLDMSDQLDDGTLNDTLESIDEAIEDKAENIAKVISEMEATVVAVDTQIKRLQERKSALQNNIKNIKQYLQREMENIGKTKIKGELFNINVQNNPPAVKIFDEKKIPRTFFVSQKPKLDKSQVKSALKEGFNVPGAELTQTKSLRIR